MGNIIIFEDKKREYLKQKWERELEDNWEDDFCVRDLPQIPDDDIFNDFL